VVHPFSREGKRGAPGSSAAVAAAIEGKDHQQNIYQGHGSSFLTQVEAILTQRCSRSQIGNAWVNRQVEERRFRAALRVEGERFLTVAGTCNNVIPNLIT
jgi:hypothetical protein